MYAEFRYSWSASSELEMEQNLAIWKAFLPFGKERRLRIQSSSYNKHAASPLDRPVYYYSLGNNRCLFWVIKSRIYTF